MMNRQNLLAAVGILALAGSALAAQGTATKPATSHSATPAQSKHSMPAQSKAAAAAETKSAKPALHEATGTVVSADATKLVLSHSVRGKRQEMTFALNPETQKQGSLDAGAHAIVKYRTENGENVATSVSAKTARAKHPAR